MPKTDESSQPGYFLTYSLWQEAIRLLQFQLAQKTKNRHFNTLSMYYYERLGEAVSLIQNEEYFTQRIASGLFYGLGEEYAVYPYPLPKSRLGLRDYKFLTYPMRVLYYAVCLYILKISEQFIRQHKEERPNISSYYGAELSFDEMGTLKLSRNAVYYRRYYKAFRRQIRQETLQNTNRKLVMRLDIANYYDSISVRTLLNLLYGQVMPSVRRINSFDAATAQQIERIFQFISRGQPGIPQFDNDITSSFIGHLYLIFGERFIDDEIRHSTNLIEDYSIIRYMDDVFISVTFQESTTKQQQRKFAERLVARVSDVLYCRLGLNMNPKTRLFWLEDEKDRDELVKCLKRVSPQFQLAPDESGETILNRVEAIIRHLQELKTAPSDPLRDYQGTLEEEILGEVFDEDISDFLDQPRMVACLESIFDGFNFDIVQARSLEFLILILKCPNAREQFRQYLLQINDLTTPDINVALKYLCQTEFDDEELLRRLEESTQLRAVMQVFNNGQLNSESPGYFGLGISQTLSVLDIPTVIEQIQRRVLCKRTEDYSTALNHLVNEFQKIAWQFDSERPRRIRDYKAPKAVSYLDKIGVPSELRNTIRKMFDRRNANTVSHPGDDDTPAWGVEQTEYEEFRDAVARCLRFVLPEEAVSTL